jgi:hypothetical protein
MGILSSKIGIFGVLLHIVIIYYCYCKSDYRQRENKTAESIRRKSGLIFQARAGISAYTVKWR